MPPYCMVVDRAANNYRHIWVDKISLMLSNHVDRGDIRTAMHGWPVALVDDNELAEILQNGPTTDTLPVLM